MEKTKRLLLPFLAAGVVALASCTSTQQSDEASNLAIDAANMDTTVLPGTDFYQYACGGWMKNNPLKPEYSSYGVFNQLREDNQEQIRTLIEELGANPQETNSVAQKISTMYSVALDSSKANELGYEPIKQELESIRSLASKTELSKMVANLQKEGISPYFALFVGPDDKNSEMNIVSIYQSGLGMGDRDYYLQKDDTMEKIRAAYKDYIRQLFEFIGASPEQAEAAVNSVMKIENAIAKSSYSREQLRDTQKNYNKITVDDFKSKNSILDWDAYLSAIGLSGLAELNVSQIDYYPALDKLLKDVSLDDQKIYLAFHLMNRAANYLGDDFVNASFDFHGRVMSGREELQPRWKRAVDMVNSALGEAVGEIYVERYFPASSKEKMLELVKNLQVALGQRISSLEWMGDSTKMKAQEKLSSFTVKIGYPDKWRDYSALEVREDSYWANYRRAQIFDFDYMLSDVGKPVDKSRWYMTPQTVNAYYSPNTNEICFPAGILQPPFFNPSADDAVNYGAIGVVIGHEMTHGFDDQGRNYDRAGNLVDWWTAEDAKQFTSRADILAQQYSNIIVTDTVHANGRYTLGENIADQGGLLVAHQAYLNSREGKSVPEPIDGFTDEQRFYLAYASLWAQNIRTEEIIRLTKTDPHSLGKWRVNAALRNIDDFYTAFGIKEGDPMFLEPENRVNVW